MGDKKTCRSKSAQRNASEEAINITELRPFLASDKSAYLVNRVKHVAAYLMILSVIKCTKYPVSNEDFCLNPHNLKIKNIRCPVPHADV